jgi:predicted nucleic acid-binding protein
MKFWDSSAVVPLVVAQSATPRLQSLSERDPSTTVWWATPVECAAAVARLEREGVLDEEGASTAFDHIARLSTMWNEIDASDAVRTQARRVLRLHPLRSGDALQLAAALVLADGRPGDLEFVVLDERLAAAARREGFIVLS